MYKFFILALLLSTSGCGSSEKSASETKGIGACISSHIEQQCVTRRICRVVCGGAAGGAGAAAGGGVGASVGVGVGAAACSELCDLVPECTSISVCDQYERTPY